MITEKLRTIQFSPDPHGLNRFDFSMRIPEKSEKFNKTDTRRYIKGCDYPESVDDLLLALEMQRLFGPIEIRRMKILDAMCGPGRLGREFLNLGSQHIMFHDGDETMITHAKTEALKSMQSGQSIGIVRSDVANIPLSDNTFDLVICHNSTHQLSDLGRLSSAMREFLRIVVPGGYVVIADFQRPRTIDFKKAASDRLDVTKEEIRELLIPTYVASFSKEEFRDALQSIVGVKDWSIKDAEPPVLTSQMQEIVDADPVKGHIMDYSPVSLRVILQKE